jgi:hypothetical protein
MIGDSAFFNEISSSVKDAEKRKVANYTRITEFDLATY